MDRLIVERADGRYETIHPHFEGVVWDDQKEASASVLDYLEGQRCTLLPLDLEAQFWADVHAAFGS